MARAAHQALSHLPAAVTVSFGSFGTGQYAEASEKAQIQLAGGEDIESKMAAKPR